MQRLLLSIFLFVLAGPLGLAIYALIKFKPLYETFQKRNVLGWTGVLLGLSGIAMGKGTQEFVKHFDLQLNVPWFFHPANLVEFYFIIGVALCFGGLMILANIKAGKWLIFWGGLISFIFTACPALFTAQAMLEMLSPVVKQATIDAVVAPILAHVLSDVMAPLYKYYIASTFIAIPLIDVYFVIILACASLAFKPESVFTSDKDYYQETDDLHVYRRIKNRVFSRPLSKPRFDQDD